MHTCKFKLGDLVRVVDPSGGCEGQYNHNEICVVTDILEPVYMDRELTIYNNFLVRTAGKSSGMYQYRFESANKNFF